MKTFYTLILLAYSCISFSQGTSCTTPHNLVLNNSCSDYAISSTTGSAIYCTDPSYSVTGRVTIFSFTTNASASCVLINLTTSGGQPAEVTLYTGCSGGGALQSQQASSSMCFNTGTGLWAPSEAFSMASNHTYFLRVWTPNGGTINMCARNYDPPNDDCSGATPIGPSPITDNNSCAKPGPTVTPGQVCAVSLENTVFYVYTVLNTGTSSINISNISCNNGNNNSENYMQIGFFTGNCASLSATSCATTSGANVSATTNSLPAGTKVYVAVDGYAGSNCTYSISAGNAQPLAAYMKYFSGWTVGNKNLLKWVTLREENNRYFDVQRSTDGSQFYNIGRIAGAMNSDLELNYSFQDNNPPAKAYYRLMQTDIDGRTKPSKIVFVNREEIPEVKFESANPVRQLEAIGIKTNFAGKINLTITNSLGQVFYQTSMNCYKGTNHFRSDLSNLPDGFYTVTAQYDNAVFSKTFIKLYSEYKTESFKR